MSAYARPDTPWRSSSATSSAECGVADSGLSVAQGTAGATGGMRGARVLVVDDSDVIRDVSRSLLEDAGVLVEEAADGAAAVAMMRENAARCQLILMDVQMPVLDGVAATRAIRTQLGAHAPPIIALTASAADDEKRACVEAGMCDHLAKPVDPDRLIEVVQRWLKPAALGNGVSQPPVQRARDAAPQTLPQLPGFDLDAGLHVVSGKVALLRSLLVRFAANHADGVAPVRALIAARDYPAARRLSHTLKGTAATLGGVAIAQAAAQLEQLLLQAAESSPHADAPIDAALAQLEQAMQRALPGLRALAEASTEAAPVAVAQPCVEIPESAMAEYEELRQLLAGNCYAARKAFAALRGKLGADDAEWRAAAAAVDALDFGQALARLDARYPANIR